jgi:hypothetical protein
MEVHKLLYVVFIAFRKLCHYFQAHKVLVVTSYPLRVVHHNSNATGNIAKWATKLAEFELDFMPRHAVKSQVLADWTPPPHSPGGLMTVSQGSGLHQASLDSLLRWLLT